MQPAQWVGFAVLVVGALLAFKALPPRTAALAVFFGGWLFAPVGVFPAGSSQAGQTHPYWILGSALPSDMLLHKAWLVPCAVLLGALLFDRASLRRFRPSWVDAPLLLWCAWPLLQVAAVRRRAAARRRGVVAVPVRHLGPDLVHRPRLLQRRRRLVGAGARARAGGPGVSAVCAGRRSGRCADLRLVLRAASVSRRRRRALPRLAAARLLRERQPVRPVDQPVRARRGVAGVVSSMPPTAVGVSSQGRCWRWRWPRNRSAAWCWRCSAPACCGCRRACVHATWWRRR